jgi:predicted transcriptional regulator of viral defense system
MRLSRLVRDGLLQNDARGVYRLPYDGENSERASWAARTAVLPGSVFCLYSAAVYHGITENLGARAYVGIKGRRRSSAGVDYFTWKEPENFDVGVETLRIGNSEVLVTNPARTLVDFFRYSHLGKRDKRMKKPVDPESLNDVVIRYMQKYGKPDIKAHRIARTFGVQEELSNFMGILQAVRPDLWHPPGDQGKA